ncbi:PHD finger protein rhinoceros [Araneus ventricosus]|uniref:PHD finger protein rhinoceros n=1 Tax=Araneus ventricosus TaxID=182803 RepID=A0A4Y2MP88_ARAVE|nr:PHD finger protein rhinoceros [Araneus ventricosus]
MKNFLALHSSRSFVHRYHVICFYVKLTWHQSVGGRVYFEGKVDGNPVDRDYYVTINHVCGYSVSKVLMMASTAKRRSKGSKASDGKRKKKPNGSEEDSPAFLSSNYAEPPVSKIYNSRFNSSPPAEGEKSQQQESRVTQLFRKDLISAMKLPDNEQLAPDDYIEILDSWKLEWEKGVQVPVKPQCLPQPNVKEIRKRNRMSSYRIPKKLIRFTRDGFFNPDHHVMSYTNTLAERLVRYDIDDVDCEWLKNLNQQREDYGLEPVEESMFEQIMEAFEVQCFENFQEAIKSEEGLGIEYDEDAICDVCRSPDSHEGNEMVFCDSCNICVHQICYGITKIPEGSWICRTCALGIRPACVLCPNRGGAMKTTRCGQKWAHVGCAVWIPEVSFLNFVKMEPIIKISQIPASRWAATCTLCKEKTGACITCSEKGCKSSFHVTCAFNEGLQMRATVKYTDSDDDLLSAFCKKHSKKRFSVYSDSEEETAASRTEKEALTSEERANLRQQKIKEKEAEFYNYVNIEEISDWFRLDRLDIEDIFYYWKQKRAINNCNRPFLTPKIDTEEDTCTEESSPFLMLKKLVHQRQDLERARNLCYMVIKREKHSKRWITAKEQIFLKQLEILRKESKKLTQEQRLAVLNANDGDLSHDKKYAFLNVPSPNMVSVLTNLAGEVVKPTFNGLTKNQSPKKADRKKSEKSPNPYAKHYLNGLVKRSERWLPLASKQKKTKPQNTKLSQDKSHQDFSYQCVTSRNEAQLDTSSFLSPKSDTRDFNVSGDTCSSFNEMESVKNDLLFITDTKDSICTPLPTESSNDTESSSFANHLLGDQKSFNSGDTDMWHSESEHNIELVNANEEIYNPGEIDLSADIKVVDIYDCESVNDDNNCKLATESQLDETIGNFSSKKKLKASRLKSKHKTLSRRKRKSNADKSATSRNSPIEDEEPADKKFKSELSDCKSSAITKGLSNEHKNVSKMSEESEVDDDKSESDSTSVPNESHSVINNNELRAENNKVSISDVKSSNLIPSSKNKVDNSEKEKPTSKEEVDSVGKLIDVESALVKSCLKIQLDRNLQLQMEQNKVKLPQPYVVLKSEDIVNCVKNKTNVSNIKTSFNRTCDDKSLKRAITSNAGKTQDCDKSELKFRPICNKNSPVRTQSPTTVKFAENGTSRLNKSSPRHNSQDKVSVPTKSSSSKTKLLNNSAAATASSLPVNKRPSSPLTKCQEKTASPSINSSDSKDSSIPKDKSVDAPLSRSVLLRGYKIPKKTRSGKPEENSLDSKRGSSPLSPLPDITPSGGSSYHSSSKSSWRKLESRSEKMASSKSWTTANGDSQQSERLVLQVKKEVYDPDSPRWQTEPNSFNTGGEMPGWAPLLPPFEPLLPPPLPPFEPVRWPLMRNQGVFPPVPMNYRPGPYKT